MPQELPPTETPMMPAQQEVLDSLKKETSLDDELAALQASVHEEETEPSEPPVSMEEAMERDVLDLFRGLENKPDELAIQSWKNKHGENAIKVITFDEKNVYVYTHLTLGQWERIQQIMQQVAGTPGAIDIEKQIKEKVIRSVVLWPELPANFFQSCRAGLPDTLYQMILVESYFLTPQQAIGLTATL